MALNQLLDLATRFSERIQRRQPHRCLADGGPRWRQAQAQPALALKALAF